MELLQFFTRMVAALLAGLIIGAERELSNKDAGLKTNALVANVHGASVFVLTSLTFKGEDYVDITRVIGQVVTGIGYLGAGVILHKGSDVKGLTTAATVWCSAGAGCLAAIGKFKELIVLTLTILFVNVGFSVVNVFIKKKIKNGDEFRND